VSNGLLNGRLADVGPYRAPFTVWALTMTMLGTGSRWWNQRTIAVRRVMAAAHTLEARQRRHCAQTAVHVP
jgi:hypothetical protein